jgi:hypothetical protein
MANGRTPRLGPCLPGAAAWPPAACVGRGSRGIPARGRVSVVGCPPDSSEGNRRQRVLKISLAISAVEGAIVSAVLILVRPGSIPQPPLTLRTLRALVTVGLTAGSHLVHLEGVD